MRKSFLHDTLAKESRAYGFTIAFWGSGIMLVAANGTPGVIEALTYGFGAVLGFGLLTLYVYRNAFSTVREEESDILALSMVHYISALLPIAAAHYLSQLPGLYAFVFTGLSTSIGYNIGMLVEEVLSEKVGELERKVIGEV